jgi:hypothetical protein
MATSINNIILIDIRQSIYRTPINRRRESALQQRLSIGVAKGAG